jgi:hypothetical protein
VFSVVPGLVALLLEYTQPGFIEELIVVAQSSYDVLLLDGVVESILGLSYWEDALKEDDEAIGLDGSLDSGHHMHVIRFFQIAKAPDAEDAVVALSLQPPSEVFDILLVDCLRFFAELLDRLDHRIIPLEHLNLRKVGSQEVHVPATACHQLEDGSLVLEPAALEDLVEILSQSQMEGLVNCAVVEGIVVIFNVELIFVVDLVNLVVWLKLRISLVSSLASFLHWSLGNFIDWAFELCWDDLVHLCLSLDPGGHGFLLGRYLGLIVILKLLLVGIRGQEPIAQL